MRIQFISVFSSLQELLLIGSADTAAAPATATAAGEAPLLQLQPIMLQLQLVTLRLQLMW